MEPGTSKMRPGRSSGSLSGAGVDLGLIFIDFLTILGRLLGSMLRVFSYKFSIKFVDVVFGGVLGAFGLDLGTIGTHLGNFLAEERFQNASRNQKRDVHENL